MFSLYKILTFYHFTYVFHWKKFSKFFKKFFLWKSPMFSINFPSFLQIFKKKNFFKFFSLRFLYVFLILNFDLLSFSLCFSLKKKFKKFQKNFFFWKSQSKSINFPSFLQNFKKKKFLIFFFPIYFTDFLKKKIKN